MKEELKEVLFEYFVRRFGRFMLFAVFMFFIITFSIAFQYTELPVLDEAQIILMLMGLSLWRMDKWLE